MDSIVIIKHLLGQADTMCIWEVLGIELTIVLRLIIVGTRSIPIVQVVAHKHLTPTVPAATPMPVPTEVVLAANAIIPSNGMSIIRVLLNSNRTSVRSMLLRVRSVGVPVPVRD